MTYLINFIWLAIISAFTPGPNNSMLMQSGMYFGFRKTIRHINGVIIGFSFLFVCINFGIYALLLKFPVINIALKVIGTVYFLFLAYKMIILKAPNNNKKSHDAGADADAGTVQVAKIDTQKGKVKKVKELKLLGFWGAFFFQWINIKAWFYAFSAIGSLPTARTFFETIIIQIIIFIVTAASAITWAAGGVLMSKLFKDERYYKLISFVLALSLVYIAYAQWVH